MKLNIREIEAHMQQAGKAKGTPKRKGNRGRHWSYNERNERLLTGPCRTVYRRENNA